MVAVFNGIMVTIDSEKYLPKRHLTIGTIRNGYHFRWYPLLRIIKWMSILANPLLLNSVSFTRIFISSWMKGQKETEGF